MDFLNDDFINIEIQDYIKNLPKVNIESCDTDKSSYLNYIGLTIDKMGKSHLNCNVFAEVFLCHTDIIMLSNDSMALYNQKKGVYELNAEGLVSRAIRYLINLSGQYWVSYFNTIALQSIKLEIGKISKVISSNNFINFKNGLLSLANFEFIPHTPDIFTTSQIPVDYRKQKIPQFEKFINEITCGDEQLKKVIQEMFGYCLTSSNKAEKTYWLYGKGKNGKSVLCKVLTCIIGEESVSSSSLTTLGSTFGLSSILGAKANICTENSSARFNSEIIKAITSADKVSVQIKYQNTLSTVITTKLIFCFNAYPITTDNTKGLYRRLCIIPFRKIVSEDDCDVNLFAKLEKELSGIVMWSLEGLKRLQNNDFRHTYSVACEKALLDYKHFANPISDFFENVFEIKSGEWIKRADIYKSFICYCKMNAYEEVGIGRFWYLLKSHWSDIGFTPSTKKYQGIDMLGGLKLKDDYLFQENKIINIE